MKKKNIGSDFRLSRELDLCDLSYCENISVVPKKAWNASEVKLREIGLGEKLSKQFTEFKKTFSFSDYLGKLKDLQINVITILDKEYPQLLKEIASPPFVLYIRGDIHKDWLKKKTIAVVGTRNITQYGEQVTREITTGLVDAGLTIVSGMAYGVDAVAHQTAIDAGGSTIAVLGCGVDLIHPKSNATIYWKIIKKAGLVISEFPIGMFADRGMFPARNRIISGLSLGVVVTEGAQDSGSLITARYAAEQGREVFAVPGPITSSLSKGPTILLKQGAKMVTEVGDILEELKLSNYPIIQSTNNPINEKINKLTKEEIKIIEILKRENLHFDEIIRKTGISSNKLGSILTMMEMKGFIKNLGSGTYGV